MSEDTIHRNALPLSSKLLEYRLESVLGAGAFGITYLGWDTHLEKHVAIKEYLPTELAVRALDGSVVPVNTEHDYNYQWGLERFIQEARTLARFSHPNIVRVNRYFESNATGYMVMDYEKGESLAQLLKRTPRPDEARLRAILLPLLDGLQAVHEAGFLHRDIKPTNVFIRENGVPVLLDFGAARQAIGGATKSLTSVLTPGYAPLEQYSSDGHQGPWTDIYALAGVLYRAIVNENPPDAVGRMRDDIVPGKLAGMRGQVGGPLLDAAGWALTLDEKRRPQSVSEWKRVLSGAAAVPQSPPAIAASGPHSADTMRPAVPTARAGEEPVAAPRAPRRSAGSEPAQPRRFGWRWVGVAVVLAVVVAWVAAWNTQRQLGKSAQVPAGRESAPGPASKPEERWPEKAKQRPKPPVTAVPERPSRDRVDRPGDENPELEQVRRFAGQEFRAADADGDGFLSRDEARRFPVLAKEFERADADGDGRISMQEFVRLRRLQAQQRVQK
jgi:hypothetical protein